LQESKRNGGLYKRVHKNLLELLMIDQFPNCIILFPFLEIVKVALKVDNS
jgi:hypothetical protein